MEELLRRCEVHEVVELMDKTNPRKSTGGKLEVALRLRTPLLKPEIVRTREKWLVLDAGASSGSLRPAVPSAAAPQQSQDGTRRCGRVPPSQHPLLEKA
ncbi:hypothetical protein DFJ73DRAFT_487567 [Zopfochytrium polystomum]|nr:hypothetical protein DFJ73DRAFT_487567 [Zopfochytrium polystomum]